MSKSLLGIIEMFEEECGGTPPDPRMEDLGFLSDASQDRIRVTDDLCTRFGGQFEGNPEILERIVLCAYNAGREYERDVHPPEEGIFDEREVGKHPSFVLGRAQRDYQWTDNSIVSVMIDFVIEHGLESPFEKFVHKRLDQFHEEVASDFMNDSSTLAI